MTTQALPQPATLGHTFLDSSWHLMQVQDDLYRRYGYCRAQPSTGAQRDCIAAFIEDVLAPRMRVSLTLTALELQRLALEHKLLYRYAHPDAYDTHVPVIRATELRLMELYQAQDDDGLDLEQSERVWLLGRAVCEIKRLIDENPDELLAI